MFRLGRLILWLVCWPLGLWRSIEAGRRNGERRRQHQPAAVPTATELDHAASVVAIADRLESAGVSNKRDRLLLTRDAMEHVHDGDGVEVAVRRVLEGRQ